MLKIFYLKFVRLKIIYYLCSVFNKELRAKDTKKARDRQILNIDK